MRGSQRRAFPGRGKIIFVQDNFNTHDPSSFYETVGPEEARRLRARFEHQYTPTHGSWLNIVQCELSVLYHHVLARRILTFRRCQRSHCAEFFLRISGEFSWQ